MHSLSTMSDSSRPRRSRKSIAFQPNASGSSKSVVTSAPEAPAKVTRKMRSKSLGPGGLDALNGTEGGKDVLKSGNGNGRRESVGPLGSCTSDGSTMLILYRLHPQSDLS